MTHLDTMMMISYAYYLMLLHCGKLYHQCMSMVLVVFITQKYKKYKYHNPVLCILYFYPIAKLSRCMFVCVHVCVHASVYVTVCMYVCLVVVRNITHTAPVYPVALRWWIKQCNVWNCIYVNVTVCMEFSNLNINTSYMCDFFSIAINFQLHMQLRHMH